MRHLADAASATVLGLRVPPYRLAYMTIMTMFATALERGTDVAISKPWRGLGGELSTWVV